MWTVPTTTREVVIRSAKSKQSNVTRHVALITHRRFASKSVEPSDTDVPVKGLYRLVYTPFCFPLICTAPNYNCQEFRSTPR